ncbi:MAG: cytochrome c peroxidase [Sphingobacteriales bacterium]|jgi:cytochrome c peroxidase
MFERRLVFIGILCCLVSWALFSLRENKAQLVQQGNYYFHSTSLSQSHQISCASCHPSDQNFTSGARLDHHIKGVAKRNTPSLWNLEKRNLFFRDGGLKKLEQVMWAPLLDEMAYEFSPFYLSNPDSSKAMETALVAYLHSLKKPANPFAFELEKQGGNLFKHHCISCHTAPLFSDFSIHPSPIQTRDVGRFRITGRPEDLYGFVSPSLIDVANTSPYFHNGSVASLNEAILLCSNNSLNPSEIDAIYSFLSELGKP